MSVDISLSAAFKLCLIPGLGRSRGEGKGYPLQYSGLENSRDCIVLGVTKSWTQLSDFHFSLPAFKSASLVAQMVKNLPAMWETWVWSLGLGRSPGEGHGNPLQYSCLENLCGQRSLAGCSPWGHRVRNDWAAKHSFKSALHFFLSVESMLVQRPFLPSC